MADLALIDAATTSGCCTHEAQADCCEPEAKQDCCGEADDGECGCAQGRDGNGGPFAFTFTRRSAQAMPGGPTFC